MPDSQIPVYTPSHSDLPVRPIKPYWLIAIGVISLILLFGLGFKLGKGGVVETEPEPLDPGQVLLTRFSRPPTAPNELKFTFFTDLNRNGVFDQNELAFSNVSVELRRRGQDNPFQAVPADTNGQVLVSGLSPADYEVRYTYADFTGFSLGDFNLRNWYQIVSTIGSTKPLPSDWESLPADAKIDLKIGIAEYLPDKVLVGQTKSQLFLVDTATNQVYGESTVYTDDAWHRFTLIDNKVYYLINNELKQFDLRDRLTQTVIKPAYGIDSWNYRLSPDTRTLVYIDNGELSYLTRDDWCGQGAIFDSEGYRLLAANLLINFRDDTQLTAIAKVTNNDSDKVYLVGCREGRFEAFVTDWALNTVSPDPVPASWQEGGFKLDILLGEVDL